MTKKAKTVETKTSVQKRNLKKSTEKPSRTIPKNIPQRAKRANRTSNKNSDHNSGRRNRLLTPLESLTLNMFYDHCIENDLTELSDNDIIRYCDKYYVKFDELLELMNKFKIVFRPTVDLSNVKRFSVFMLKLVEEEEMSGDISECKEGSIEHKEKAETEPESKMNEQKETDNTGAESIYPLRLLDKSDKEGVKKENEDENEIEFKIIIEE